MRLCMGLRLACREDGLNLDPIKIIVSEPTTTSPVSFKGIGSMTVFGILRGHSGGVDYRTSDLVPVVDLTV